MKRCVFLDHHSTTPVEPRVLEQMLPYFTEHFGNAESRSHAFGWAARAALDEARERVRVALGAAEAAEVVFTSGATESNNLALRGVALSYGRPAGAAVRGHLLALSTEHASVLEPLAQLAREGFEVTLVPVERSGLLAIEQLEGALRADTLLVSVAAANAEIGTLQPLAEIARVCRARGVKLHCDAAQAVGKVPLDVEVLGLDLVSVSAHKVYGPKGIGALYVRGGSSGLRLEPMLQGGGQERGLRSGTVNVPGAVGLGAALALATELREAEAERLLSLRERLWAGLLAALPKVELNGDENARLPGNLNVLLEGLSADALMARMPLVAVSSGSACGSGQGEPSHVLTAIGRSPEQSRCSLRFGLGRGTTAADIDLAVEQLARHARALGFG